MRGLVSTIALVVGSLSGLAQLAAPLDDGLLLDGLAMDLRVSPSMAGIKILWAASDTVGLVQYEVQRANEFGDWSTVHRLPARRALIQLDESFEDPQPFNGLNAYRVARVMRDGSVVYSETRVLTYLGIRGMRLYPNPVTAGQPVYLEFLGAPLDEFQLEIVDDKGKRLDYQNFSGTGEREQVSFIPEAPHSGTYIVRLFSNEIPLESWPLQIK